MRKYSFFHLDFSDIYALVTNRIKSDVKIGCMNFLRKELKRIGAKKVAPFIYRVPSGTNMIWKAFDDIDECRKDLLDDIDAKIDEYNNVLNDLGGEENACSCFIEPIKSVIMYTIDLHNILKRIVLGDRFDFEIYD